MSSGGYVMRGRHMTSTNPLQPRPSAAAIRLGRTVAWFWALSLLVGNSSAVQGSSRDHHPLENGTFTCCAEVFGSCRTACKNLSLVSLASGLNSKDSGLGEVRKFCPPIHTEFWECMNQTLSTIAKGSHWSGRPCCGLGSNERCQNTCVASASRQDLKQGCRQSDEHNLFDCVQHQEDGEACCSQSRSADCMQACADIFRSRGSPSREHRKRLQHACNGGSNKEVMACIKQHTDETPIANVKVYLPCCQLSTSQKCQSICEKVLSTGLTTEEAIDRLESAGCGPPLPQDPMWQCFLSPERQQPPPSTSNSSGMDSAKLHCCQKALAPKCRRLCLNTFSNNWIEGWQDFEMSCFSSASEHALRQCIEEVDEPCDLGCDSLSFCTNFNARPTELFRSCTAAADSTAKQSLELWQTSGQILLPGLQLPLKNVSKCAPASWKAVACALHVKPCNYNSHSNQICREDCYSLLNECLDWAQLHESEHSAASLCAKMSPADKSTPCISLATFLSPSELSGSADPHVVKSPCRQNPCDQNHVCQVDSNLPTGFRCVPGCVLGEASSYFVPTGAYVRIPVTGANSKGCLKICRCNENGHIDSCQPLPCITYESCSLAGRTIAHLAWFYVECNICSCFAGEITCTKKQCRIQGVSDHSYTSFPCNCPAHYVPVCGKNGKTYPNACIAKCNGFQDYEFDYGPCDARTACDDHDCPAHSVCVPERQVCLSSMHRPCLQYQCVNISGHCRDPFPSPMCDTREKTHSSLCHLIRSKEVLSYPGHCNRLCKKNQMVCGINGVTYRSECEAWSDFSSVDYPGECREVGLLTATWGSRCVHTKCKALPPNCLSIIPPAACCPVCSGSFRVIYSRKQIDRALYALNEKNAHLLTLKYVLKSLSALIRIADCRLSGFLTIEADIFVTVQASQETSSDVQLEACHREAEKIATLISTQSHRITSDLTLGALTFASLAQPDINSAASSSLARPAALLLVYLFLVLKGCRGW